jgi:hypothetical protein
LRSPGDNASLVADVDYGGAIRVDGGIVDYAGYGVRPALWVNLADPVTEDDEPETEETTEEP